MMSSVADQPFFRPLSACAAGLACGRHPAAYTLTASPVFGNRTPVQAFSQCRADRSRPEQVASYVDRPWLEAGRFDLGMTYAVMCTRFLTVCAHAQSETPNSHKTSEQAHF